jgi:uncharacterized membrane protein
MHKELKSAVFAVLLIAASHLFGNICEQIGQAYGLILYPSTDILDLGIQLLLAIGAVALTAGLVAVLVRPLWVCFIVFGLSALTMLISWELKASSAVLTAVYFIASLIYGQSIAGELENRLRFSVRPIYQSQSILLVALVIVTCGSFYLGYAAEIRREGFSIPPFLIEMVMGRVEQEVSKLLPTDVGEKAIAEFREQLEGALEEIGQEVARLLPEALREASIAEFRSQLTRALDEMEKEASERLEAADREAVMTQFGRRLKRALVELVENAIRPYEQWIPRILAINLLMFLLTITGLLSWTPILALWVIFPLLTALGVTKVTTATREVERMTLG